MRLNVRPGTDGGNPYGSGSDRKPITGMAITLAFMCGHKGARAGAFMRGHIPWRCAKCVSAKSEARNAVACERASITTKKEAQ